MKRLLLVDDDPACLLALGERLRFAFRKEQLAVDIADSASTGIILGHTYRYDAVIVDLVMPGTTGITFVRQLRQTQPEVPVIMVSGLTTQDEIGAQLKAVAFFPKPIDFAGLCNTLMSVFSPTPSPMQPRSSVPHRRHTPSVRS
jgi:DNA-binding response OmpR family regulator